MNADAGRRTFVRNMAVSVPVLVGAAALPSTALASVPPPRRAGIGQDPGFDRILERIAVLHNDLRRRGAVPEDGRAAGSYLRTLAGYRQVTERDAALSDAMRSLTDRHGVEAFVTGTPDRALIAQGFRYYGVQAASPILDPSPAMRRQALDILTRQGAGPSYDELANYLISSLGWFVVDPSGCTTLREAKDLIEAMAALMCLATTFLPVFAPECFASTTVLAILDLLIVLGGC